MDKDDWQDVPLKVTASREVAGHDDWQDVPSDPSSSPVTAATTGLMQGAVPFASSIAGAGKAGMDAITGVRGPLAGGSIDDIGDDYRQARDSFTEDAKKAAEANPGTALVSNIAGGFGNPLFKGAHSLPKAMTAGGIQALGMSDADLTKGEFKDAAKDTALGTALGAAGYGAAKAVPAVLKGAGWAGKKALTNFGTTGEAVAARLEGRAQDTARSYPQLAEDMAAAHRKLSTETKILDNEAWATLSKDKDINNGALPKGYLLKNVDDSLAKLKTDGHLVGEVDKAADKALNNIREDIAQYGDAISESDVKKVIQSISRNIDYQDTTKSITNKLLAEVRHGLDETLKFQNPSYRKAMIPVAERTNNLDEIQRLFNLDHMKDPSKAAILRPTDATAEKIKSSVKETKAITQEFLDKFKEFTGQDFEGSANDYRLAQQFQVKSPQNSTKKSFIGAAIGSLVGSAVAPGAGTTIGAGLGAAAGGTMDAYGGKVAGKLIDSYLAAGNSAAFGKFAPVIEQAAKQGPKALAMTSSILSTNPEFKKLMGIDPDSSKEHPNASRVLGSHGK